MIRAAACLLLLGAALASPAPRQTTTPARPAADDAARQFEHGVTLLESRGSVSAAARVFETVAEGTDRPLAARALVYLGECYERLGDPRARGVYTRVVRQFADQSSAVSEARVRLARLPVQSNGSEPQLALRRFWTKPPLAGFEIANVSQDGRWLALFDANGVVALQAMETGRIGGRRQLGHAVDGPPCVVWTLVLAPDASSVVFACQVQDQPFELRRASLRSRTPDEGVLHRVGAGEVIEPMEWRRAGEVLARVTRSDGTSEIVVVPSAGGSPRTVVTMPFVSAFLSMSPDGRWVAYDGPDTGTPPRRDVLLVPAGGGTPQVIVGGPADDLMPMWTTDGRQLAWISDRTGTSGLWMQGFEDGALIQAPRIVAPDLGRVAQPLGLTGPGSYVYFRQTGMVDVHVVDLDSTGRPVGPPSVEGTRYVGATMSPTWSPDGTRLAYRVELGVSRVHAIGIREAGGTRERIVASPMSWIDMPRYSPDGTRLLARGRSDSEGYGYYVIDAETGATTALKTVPPMEEDRLGLGQWEASGQGVIFFQAGAFFRVDVTTRHETPLFPLPKGAHVVGLPDPGFSVSRDGSLAYVQGAAGVTSLVVRQPDGTSREVLRSQPQERLAGVSWGPKGATLFFTRMATDMALTEEQRWPAVWLLDLATGEARALGIAMPRLRGLTASPDGRSLAFTSGSPTREPWILEHFLPRPGAARTSTR